MNKRFTISFHGDIGLDEGEFFGGEEPDVITPESIRESLEGIGLDELLYHWNLASDLMVVIHDSYTGAYYTLGDFGKWTMLDSDLMEEANRRLDEQDPLEEVRSRIVDLERRSSEVEIAVADIKGVIDSREDAVKNGLRAAIDTLKEYDL